MNKLIPVIIDNPCQKCWQYRTRDAVMATATLALWLVVLSRLHGFYMLEEAIIDQLYGSTMLKMLVAGFITTFLTFHLWAIYNRYLYTSVLKRGEPTPPTPLLEEHAPNQPLELLNGMPHASKPEGNPIP
ncbi:hypothetical protein [Vreelandella sp. EE27]